MGHYELEGDMVYFIVDYCITTHTLQTQTRPIVVGIIIYRVTCFNNERLCLVISKYIGFPVIKISSLVRLENHFGVDGRRNTHR